jgi:hypothetical protein
MKVFVVYFKVLFLNICSNQGKRYEKSKSECTVSSLDNVAFIQLVSVPTVLCVESEDNESAPYAGWQHSEKRLLALSCLSVRPPAGRHGTTWLPLNGFS